MAVQQDGPRPAQVVRVDEGLWAVLDFLLVHSHMNVGVDKFQLLEDFPETQLHADVGASPTQFLAPLVRVLAGEQRLLLHERLVESEDVVLDVAAILPGPGKAAGQFAPQSILPVKHKLKTLPANVYLHEIVTSM